MRNETTGEIMIGAIRHRLPALLAALVALSLAACGDQPRLQSVAIEDGQAYVAVGVPQQLTVTGQYSDGRTALLDGDLTWASSDPAVASVEPTTGLVIPWTKGTARITASHGASGLTATVDVTSRAVVSVSAAALPLAGAVDTTTTYLHVSGLLPGAIYEPTLSPMTDDVDLSVYPDLAMQPDAMLCGSAKVGTVPESCLAPANGAGELWIAVDGQWTRSGATFSLAVPAARASTLAATLAYPAYLPYSGYAGTNRSYYEVTGLTPGAVYEVRISNLTTDVDLAVYSDLFEYGMLCQSYGVGTGDDACEAAANTSGELVVEIDGETTRDGGPYTLAVTAK